jgi:hypothetical protein
VVSTSFSPPACGGGAVASGQGTANGIGCTGLVAGSAADIPHLVSFDGGFEERKTGPKVSRHPQTTGRRNEWETNNFGDKSARKRETQSNHMEY